ncbi:LPXTG cell wall anchor domain-containing protein [Listeria booriae]|nr:LPXTG cell wall anchor domain-containing protein [Listeria booriae]
MTGSTSGSALPSTGDEDSTAAQWFGGGLLLLAGGFLLRLFRRKPQE